jgi:hypothetical protein
MSRRATGPAGEAMRGKIADPPPGGKESVIRVGLATRADFVVVEVDGGSWLLSEEGAAGLAADLMWSIELLRQRRAPPPPAAPPPRRRPRSG